MISQGRGVVAVPKRMVIVRWVSGLAVGLDIDWDLSALNIWLGIISITYVWNLQRFRDNLIELSKDNIENGQ